MSMSHRAARRMRLEDSVGLDTVRKDSLVSTWRTRSRGPHLPRGQRVRPRPGSPGGIPRAARCCRGSVRSAVLAGRSAEQAAPRNRKQRGPADTRPTIRGGISRSGTAGVPSIPVEPPSRPPASGGAGAPPRPGRGSGDSRLRFLYGGRSPDRCRTPCASGDLEHVSMPAHPAFCRAGDADHEGVVRYVPGTTARRDESVPADRDAAHHVAFAPTDAPRRISVFSYKAFGSPGTSGFAHVRQQHEGPGNTSPRWWYPRRPTRVMDLDAVPYRGPPGDGTFCPRLQLSPILARRRMCEKCQIFVPFPITAPSSTYETRGRSSPWTLPGS